MTSRMQISLDPDLRLRATRKAAKQGVSMAEYVRRAIERDLGGAQAKADISSTFDLGSSAEPTDVGENKKSMLAESLHRKMER
jgi:hypothetical protein